MAEQSTAARAIHSDRLVVAGEEERNLAAMLKSCHQSAKDLTADGFVPGQRSASLEKDLEPFVCIGTVSRLAAYRPLGGFGSG